MKFRSANLGLTHCGLVTQYGVMAALLAFACIAVSQQLSELMLKYLQLYEQPARDIFQWNFGQNQYSFSQRENIQGTVICELLAILFKTEYVNSFDAEIGMFQKEDNTMATDALAPCITRPSTT